MQSAALDCRYRFSRIRACWLNIRTWCRLLIAWRVVKPGISIGRWRKRVNKTSISELSSLLFHRKHYLSAPERAARSEFLTIPPYANGQLLTSRCTHTPHKWNDTSAYFIPFIRAAFLRIFIRQHFKYLTACCNLFYGRLVSVILLFPLAELIMLWGVICTRCNYSTGAICLIAGWRIMMKIATVALVWNNWFI